jgi:hypothetical protein
MLLRAGHSRPETNRTGAKNACWLKPKGRQTARFPAVSGAKGRKCNRSCRQGLEADGGPSWAPSLAKRTPATGDSPRGSGGDAPFTASWAQRPLPLAAPKSKIFLFTRILIYGKCPLSPCHCEGRFAIVTKRGAGCDGRSRRQVLAPGETSAADGEIVWSWRRDPGATPAVSPAGNGGKKGRFPGESTYKP